jgi:hypothetical protein
MTTIPAADLYWRIRVGPLRSYQKDRPVIIKFDVMIVSPLGPMHEIYWTFETLGMDGVE